MKKGIKSRIIYLVNQWWFYPILWFVCVFVLALISQLNFNELSIHKIFFIFSISLPLPLVFILNGLFENFINEKYEGVLFSIFYVLYYLLYIVGFSILPFIKGRFKKFIIWFLILWILLVFVSCIPIAITYDGGFEI